MAKRHLVDKNLAMKFSGDFKKMLEGFTIDEQIHITETLLKIKKIVEDKKEVTYWDEVAQLNDTEFIQKYRKRFRQVANVQILEYFTEHALMYKSVGDEKWDTYTEKEFNKLNSTEQNFSDNEFKSFLFLINNLLQNTRRSLYLDSEPDGQKIKLKEITINEDCIEPLKNILKDYFSQEEREKLSILIDGDSIEGHIIFLGNCIKLVDVFLRLKEKGKIRENGEDINKWICKYFKYINKKQPRKFEKDNVHKILTVQQTISKPNKIELDFIKNN